jgi:predicted nuclease of predicted toxin-antitoxin system
LIRLLLDQGLPRSSAKLLSDAGWDVSHVGDLGLSKADDSQILDFARRENRICVTLDADFHALLATSGAASPSVIRIRREGLNAKAMAELLTTIWPRIEDAIASGVLITITEHSLRLRGLPVSRKKG